MLFAVWVVAAQLDRDYIHKKTLKGQQIAAARRNHGGRPKVLDEDDVLFARALRDKGTPMPDIVKKLTIKTGKNAGQHPLVTAPSPTPDLLFQGPLPLSLISRPAPTN
jgi:hypothetical protein